MKTFNVMWEESHSVVVKAKNEEEAIELVNDGYGSDDNVQIMSGFDAFEQKIVKKDTQESINNQVSVNSRGF